MNVLNEALADYFKPIDIRTYVEALKAMGWHNNSNNDTNDNQSNDNNHKKYNDYFMLYYIY